MSLVDELIKNGWLRTPCIIEAFRAIKREDFLSEDLKDLADINEALPIGWGQTISQPLVVAFMLEKIQPQPGEKILDIGSGSGWTTALLAHIVGSAFAKLKVKSEKLKVEGKVIGIEIIPALKDFGEANVAKYNFIKSGVAEFVCQDGNDGYPEEAPYDKILCSAQARDLPESWKEQLKIGGRIVTPISQSIWVFEKKSDQKFFSEEYPGFVFVPLIKS